MKIDGKIRDENLQYNINREELSSGKTDKHRYLTGAEILPFDQSRMILQAKFTSSLLEKDLGK